MRIVIVGAGPAGCHLAYRLGNTGHEILLFDPRAPYEKPCGGGLSPLVAQHFPEILALPLPWHHPRQMLLRASDGSQADYNLGQTSAWAVASREDLGRALLERALRSRRPEGPASGTAAAKALRPLGACVPVIGGNMRLIRQKVIGVERTGNGWGLRTADSELFSTDFLVGADGMQSVVRQQVVGPIPRKHLGMAVGYRVRGAPEALVFQTFSDLEGYLWSFPRPGPASMGIATRLGSVPPQDLWNRMDRFLAEMCPGAEKKKRWAALLPMAQDPSLWDTPCAGPDWALLGDAAGHVHPITGEGIVYALWSAELLAQALVEGDPLAYEALWRGQFGHHLGLRGTASAAVSGAVHRLGSGTPQAQGSAQGKSPPRSGSATSGSTPQGLAAGGYEIVFQLIMATAMSGATPPKQTKERNHENEIRQTIGCDTETGD